MAKNKSSFKAGNPKQQLDQIKLDNSRYKIGAKDVSFYDIREMKPVFAFDYLSLNGSELCYNCDNLTANDYLGLLEGLKKNSFITYNELSTNKYYRFHKIDFDKDDISIKRQTFKETLSFKPDDIDDIELPTLYQIDVHYKQKARVCGFLYKGIFYLVWFDKDHSIYERNK